MMKATDQNIKISFSDGQAIKLCWPLIRTRFCPCTKAQKRFLFCTLFPLNNELRENNLRWEFPRIPVKMHWVQRFYFPIQSLLHKKSWLVLKCSLFLYWFRKLSQLNQLILKILTGRREDFLSLDRSRKYLLRPLSLFLSSRRKRAHTVHSWDTLTYLHLLQCGVNPGMYCTREVQRDDIDIHALKFFLQSGFYSVK